MSITTEHREIFFRNDSTSTISSLDAEQLINQRLCGNQINSQVPSPTESGPKVGSICIEGSKTIQVGDQITYHIYQQAPGLNFAFLIIIISLNLLCLNRCQCYGT